MKKAGRNSHGDGASVVSRAADRVGEEAAAEMMRQLLFKVDGLVVQSLSFEHM